MYPLKKSISLVGLALLATVAVVITTGTVGATPKVNSIAAAPPTPSIPVAVTNTPLPVQGTVAISNSPNVTLSNTSATPLYVRDVDSSPLQPYMMWCTLDAFSPPGGNFPSCIFNPTPPAGKRFVIEFISLDLELSSGTKPVSMNFETEAAGQNSVATFLPVTFQGSTPYFTFPDHYLAAQQVRLYTDSSAPGPVLLNITVSDQNSSGSVTAYASGHLVNIP